MTATGGKARPAPAGGRQAELRAGARRPVRRKRHGGEHKVIRVSPLPVVPDLPQPGRTLVMGVVNVTPDSFSDGGEWFDPAAAITHGLDLLAEGADIIDVGGESTRPGATRPEVAEELRRILPVIRELAAAGACVSIDTMRAAVAEPCDRSRRPLVNDVSGGKADDRMLHLVAESGVPYICMHWRGHSEDMQSKASYADVVAEVIAELRTQLDEADRAGVAADKVIIDPGFGFAKTGEHNWQLLERLEEFDVLGRPMLAGVSRKAFLGRLLADPDGSPRPAKERDDATTALTTVLALRGVWGVRVHSVRASRDAIAVAQRLLESSPTETPTCQRQWSFAITRLTVEARGLRPFDELRRAFSPAIAGAVTHVARSDKVACVRR